jgi:hypothetical protein
MTHRVVTAQTCELTATRCRVRRFDRVDNFFVTIAAGLLGDLPAVRLDLNVILVAASGEEKGMPEAVGCLGCILPDEICRGVAVIAGGNASMRRFKPPVVLFAHDVAVGARRRVVGQIRPSPGIRKRVDPNAKRYTDSYSDQHALNHASVHLAYRSRDASDATVARRIDTAPLFMVPLLSRAHTG